SKAFALNLEGIYMMPIDVPEIVLDRGSALLGATLGLLSALVAATIPARQAVSIHPLEALRPGARRREATLYVRAAFAGGVLIAVVAIAWSLRATLPIPRNANGAIAILGLLMGASLVAPAAVRSFAIRIEPLLSRLLGPVGALASRSIVDHVGR